MNETPDDLARSKPTAACLSQWQLSRWAMGIAGATDAEAFDAHVATCPHCAAQWQAARASQAANAYAPLPEALRQLRPARAPWTLPASWQGALGSWGGYALAAALLVVLAGPTLMQRLAPQSQIRLKGSEALVVARLRDGSVEEGPWASLQNVRPGDQVRFKAHTGTVTWQALYVRQAETWQKLFVGNVAADDWVPVALTVNAGAPNDLRLLVCPVAPANVLDEPTVPEGCAGYDARL